MNAKPALCLVVSVLLGSACGVSLDSQYLGTYETKGTVDQGGGPQSISSASVVISQGSGAEVTVSVPGLSALTATPTDVDTVGIGNQKVTTGLPDGGVVEGTASGTVIFSNYDGTGIDLSLSVSQSTGSTTTHLSGPLQ